MPDARNPFTSTRTAVDEDTAHAQEHNRLWWERMPMTDADWHADEGLPVGAEDRALKARFGMCLVAEFDKPVD